MWQDPACSGRVNSNCLSLCLTVPAHFHPYLCLKSYHNNLNRILNVLGKLQSEKDRKEKIHCACHFKC